MNNQKAKGTGMSKKSMQGFTLIELMVVVIVIVILGSIALPNFQEAMQKGRRADAKNILLEVAALQERFYSDSGFYGQLNVISSGATLTSDDGYYEITAAVGGGRPQTYVLTATAQNGQQNDSKCGNYTYNQAGTVTVSGTESVGDCW